MKMFSAKTAGVCILILSGLLAIGVGAEEEKPPPKPVEGLAVAEGAQTPTPQASLEIKADGQVFVNGKPVKEMSAPEIRKAMLQISEQLKRDSAVMALERQTAYLLQRIDELQTQLIECEKGGK